MNLIPLFIIFISFINRTHSIHNWSIINGFGPEIIQFDSLENPIIQATVVRSTICNSNGCKLAEVYPKIVLTNVTNSSFKIHLTDLSINDANSQDKYTFLIAWVVLESGFVHGSPQSDIIYAGSINLDLSKKQHLIALDNSKIRLYPENSVFSTTLVSKNDNISNLDKVDFTLQLDVKSDKLATANVTFILNDISNGNVELHYLIVNIYKLHKHPIAQKYESDFYIQKLKLIGKTMPFKWAYHEPILLPCHKSINSRISLQWIPRTNESNIIELHLFSPSSEKFSNNIYFIIMPMHKSPPIMTLDTLPSGINFYESRLIPHLVYTWLSGINTRLCSTVEPSNDSLTIDCYRLCNFYAANPRYCKRDKEDEDEYVSLSPFEKLANNTTNCIARFLSPLCNFPKEKQEQDKIIEVVEKSEKTKIATVVDPIRSACKGSSSKGHYTPCGISQLDGKWLYSAYNACKGEELSSVAMDGDEYRMADDVCKLALQADKIFKCKGDECPEMPSLEFHPIKNEIVQDPSLYVFCCPTGDNIEVDSMSSGGILYVPVYGSQVTPPYTVESCLFSEWEEWSSCELPCKIKNKTVNRRRRRTLLQGSDSKCTTIEIEPCKKVSDCSDFCLTSEWSQCMTSEKSHGSFYSVRSILYDSEKCNRESIQLTRKCEGDFDKNLDQSDLKKQKLNIPSQIAWSGCTQPCNNVNNMGINIMGKDPENIKEVETRSCVEKIPKCVVNEMIDCNDIGPTIPGLSKHLCVAWCNDVISNCDTDHFKCYALARDENVNDEKSFENCRFSKEIESKIDKIKNFQHNKCYISRASYIVSDKSWVDQKSGACHCYEEGAIPCNEQDIFLSMESLSGEMIASSVCPARTLAPIEMNTIDFISYGHNKTAYCPIEYKTKSTVTFGSINQDDLKKFCNYGPGYSKFPQLDHNLFKYQCHYATMLPNPLNIAFTSNECIAICNKKDEECKNEDKDLHTCLNESLIAFANEMNGHACHLSEFDPLDCDMAYSITSDSSVDPRTCISICKYNKRKCEAKILEKNGMNRRKCLKSKLANNEMFKRNCEFKPIGRVPGGGFVLCKFPPIDCKYSEWGEWSDCSSDCNIIDNVATRKRTRTLINPASNYGKTCNSDDSLGTIDIEICKHLPPCQADKWISPTSVEQKPLVLDFVEDVNEPDQEIDWVKEAFDVYPKLLNSGDINSCKLFKSEGTHYSCKCPSGYSPCSVGESIKSPDFITSVKTLCSNNPLAYVSFEDVENIYYYLCNIDMLYAEEDVDIGNIRCDALDNFQYSSCFETGQTLKNFNFIQFFLIGVLASFFYLGISILITSIPKAINRKEKTE